MRDHKVENIKGIKVTGYACSKIRKHARNTSDRICVLVKKQNIWNNGNIIFVFSKNKIYLLNQQYLYMV